MTVRKLPGIVLGVTAIFCLAATPTWAQRAACNSTSGEGLVYYPKAAQAQGVEGSATIRCRVTYRGELANCVAVSETPEGYCFGKAAVEMAAGIKLTLKQRPQDG